MWKELSFIAAAGFLALSISGLAACSTTTTATAGEDSESTRVCVRERPTGSHVAVRVCRTRAQIAEERENARETIEEIGRIEATATPDT